MRRTTLYPLGRRTPVTQLPAPWRRIDDGSLGKLGATYIHPAGYTIQHCGHPTANFPYALYGPDGFMVLAPNGRAFMTLTAVARFVFDRVRRL